MKTFAKIATSKTIQAVLTTIVGASLLTSSAQAATNIPNLFRHFQPNTPIAPFVPVRVTTGLDSLLATPVTFSRSRPTLIFLVHGDTGEPKPLVPSPFEGFYNPGTLLHSHFYWNQKFVNGLLNSTVLQTLSGHTMDDANWMNPAFLQDDVMEDHIIFPRMEKTNTPVAPRFAVAHIHVNGIGTVGVHTQRVLDQAKKIYDTYQRAIVGMTRRAEDNPQIVFMAHSKGGLVTRYILCAPTGPVAGATLSDGQVGNAKFLRDRTLYAVTMGSPHEGSPLCDEGTNIAGGLARAQEAINTLWDGAEWVLNGAIQLVEDVSNIVLNPFGVEVDLQTVDLSDAPIDLNLVAQFLNPDALATMSVVFTRSLNVGPLSPDKMVRGDGSLIPLHCLGSRTAGGKFYTAMGPVAINGPVTAAVASTMITASDVLNEPALTGSTYGLMGLDWSLHNVVNKSWGNNFAVGANKPLDLVRRASITMTARPQFLAPRFRDPILNIEPQPLFYIRNQGDGEIDNDGMVAINSALGIKLGRTTLEPFDHSRQVNVSGHSVPGSWYRLYRGAWDFCNHQTMTKELPVGLNLRMLVLNNAGPRPAIAGAVSSW